MEENIQEHPKGGGMNMMMVVAGVIILLVLGGGAYYYMNQKSAMAPAMKQDESMQPTKAMEMETTMAPSTAPSEAATAGSAMTPSGKVVEITVKGQNYSFAPNVINAKKGDTIKVTFQNTGGFHDFVIDEFNAKTKTIKDGETDTVEFVADKAGTFEFYCSVGKHREMGMKGNLIVQ